MQTKNGASTPFSKFSTNHNTPDQYNFMQRLILTLVLLLSVALVGVGETYQITALTTPSITIGGKKLKVGDRFDSSNNIKWIDNDQKMEVKALSTGALYIFSHKVFQSKGGALSIAVVCVDTARLGGGAVDA